MVLSDRAQVFLIAALQVWNNESMNEFLQRAYRIVTNEAVDKDYELTNIHACLAHVLLVSKAIYSLFIYNFFLKGCSKNH